MFRITAGDRHPDAFTAEVAFETLVAIFNGFACFVCSLARKVVHKFEAINHTVFEQTKMVRNTERRVNCAIRCLYLDLTSSSS